MPIGVTFLALAVLLAVLWKTSKKVTKVTTETWELPDGNSVKTQTSTTTEWHAYNRGSNDKSNDYPHQM